jgi:uncharacterized membrane protein YdjX (TVP38/TMEM64 family)
MKELSADIQANGTPSRFSMGKVVILALFALAIGAFFYFDLKQYLSLESLKRNRDGLLAYTDQHYTASVAIYIVLYCLQTTFSLPGATIFTLAGGFLFGSVLGTLYVNVAATSGATLAFLASRYLMRDWVERTFGNRLGPIQEGFAKNAFSYLLMLRLVPLFPFFLVNLVSGLTRISVGTYVLATAVGIVPASFVFANAGRQLGSIQSLSEIASPRVLGAFALLGLLSLVPVFYRRLSRSPNQ